MEFFSFARVIHVIAVVLWIGGVAMVTTVIIPSVKRMKSKENKVDIFENLEGRFSLQAKVSTLLTGISGFYMMYELHAWHRYLDIKYWWIHSMTLTWLIFTIILFFLEPIVLHKVYKEQAEQNPDRTFKIIHIMHWVLLVLSIITIAGAVAGSHGWNWIE